MSAALPIPRPKLVSTPLLAAIGVGLLLVLALSFRNLEGIMGLMTQRAPDAVSLRYLALMVHMKPEDQTLRLTLARQLHQVGQVEEAAAALAPLLKEQPDRLEVLTLDLAIEQSRVSALESTDPERPARIEAAVKRLRESQAKVNAPPVLAEFARIGLSLNQPRLAAEIYQRLSALDPGRGTHWLSEAARWFMASGDSLKAGDVLDDATRLAGDDDSYRTLAGRALEAYVGAMSFERALAHGETYRRRLPGDIPLLQQLIAIALAGERPALARDLGRELMALKPGDPQALKEQIARELAVSDYRGAWALARELAKQEPACASCQEQAAVLAEQAGHAEEALPYWLAQVRAGARGKALEESLRLAFVTKQDTLWLELLSHRVKERALSKEDYFAAEAVYKRSRSPQAWVEFLHQAIARSPNDRLLWDGLVLALGKSGRSDALIAALEAMESRFGSSPEATLRLAHLLTDLGRKDLALKKLRAASGGVGAEAKDFWVLYGDLAWQLEAGGEATKAYTILAAQGAREALVFERLAYLARKSGKTEDAIGHAERGWRVTGQPRLLVLALDTAAQAKRWDRLGALLAGAAASEASLARTEGYWLVKARYEAHTGQTAKALATYERILRDNPGASAARAGLLWLLIDHREKARLAAYVDQWRGASRDPALADAFGAAYLALGRYQDALAYYDREKGSHKQDPLWLLQYADLLQRTGRLEAAATLRDHVLRNFRTTLARQAKTDKPSALAYLNLVNRQDGAAERYRALQMLSNRAEN